ncbi:alpha/beta hydrolase [Halobacteriales archaeon QS_4_69_34]|nr:MAG: alpha/beta hydrolase [Halobacteriales archaeon QS_4_69_34]
MALTQTPEERFADVPDYPYEPAYVEVGDDGARMAYVDVGHESGGDGAAADEGVGDSGTDDSGETFLCLHGEPTWGFLYRKMIPTLAEAGRVVVPDFLGFGRSDKYTERDEYSFETHYEALAAFVEALELTNVTLVCQDWGGILGLTYAADEPDRFARLVPMNTGVPSGDQEMPEEWEQFREFVEGVEELPIRMLIQNTTATDLADAELAAYEAPFHTEAAKAGAREWPDMVPREDGGDGAEMTRAAAERLGEWTKPALVLFADSDPITRPNRDPLRELIPTASEQPDTWVEGAMHFLQEDAGEDIAEGIVAFVERTR